MAEEMMDSLEGRRSFDMRGDISTLSRDEAGGEVVAVAAAEVVVLPVGRDVGLDCVVAVETTDVGLWGGAEVPGLGYWVAVGEDGEDGEDSG